MQVFFIILMEKLSQADRIVYHVPAILQYKYVHIKCHFILLAILCHMFT